MSKAAEGTIYARYDVVYTVTADGWDQTREFRETVALIEGYTCFESIPKILAVKRGVKPYEIFPIGVHVVPPA